MVVVAEDRLVVEQELVARVEGSVDPYSWARFGHLQQKSSQRYWPRGRQMQMMEVGLPRVQ